MIHNIDLLELFENISRYRVGGDSFLEYLSWNNSDNTDSFLYSDYSPSKKIAVGCNKYNVRAKPASVMSYNCSGCTTKEVYPFSSLLAKIYTFDDSYLEYRVIMFSDILYDSAFLGLLKNRGYNFVFVPSITNEKNVFGLLTLSRLRFDNVGIYRNKLSECHTTDHTSRAAYYPQLVVSIAGINFVNYYGNAFTSYRQRIRSFTEINDFFCHRQTKPFLLMGDFNCYGKNVNSTKKWYPKWYQLAFLPSLISTLVNKGRNQDNAYELAAMIQTVKALNLDLDLRFIPSYKSIVYGIFGIKVSWKLDCLLCNTRIQEFRSQNGIFGILEDHPIMIVDL